MEGLGSKLRGVGLCSPGCSSFGDDSMICRYEPVAAGGSASSFPGVAGLIPDESLQETGRGTICKNV